MLRYVYQVQINFCQMHFNLRFTKKKHFCCHTLWLGRLLVEWSIVVTCLLIEGVTPGTECFVNNNYISSFSIYVDQPNLFVAWEVGDGIIK